MNFHRALKIYVGKKQVRISLAMAWMSGVVYIVSYFTPTCMVEHGSCIVYFFPNDKAREVSSTI